MRKFQIFSVSYILREINFRDFRSWKTAILTMSLVLTYDFFRMIFTLFERWNLENHQKVAKKEAFELQEVAKSISRKICVTEISKNFHTVHSTLWQNQKFTLTEKIFREIIYLVISLINARSHEIFATNVWERISVISTLCTVRC